MFKHKLKEHKTDLMKTNFFFKPQDFKNWCMVEIVSSHTTTQEGEKKRQLIQFLVQKLFQ